jgi:uncharacterized damage-inducible protein DinB/predicted RNase H-like HicB family nuclease
MTTYDLVLESGPKKMRTWVQLPALPGCVFNGATTDETLAAAPAEIRRFLALLARHGERVDPADDIEVRVQRHVTDGKWVGFGGPELEEDLEPLSRDELERDLRWAGWMRDEMLQLLEGVDDDAFARKPAKGRPIRQIVEHVIGAEYGYVRRFGKIEGVPGPGNLEAMSRDELMHWMSHLREREFDRLRALSDDELRAVDRAGSQLKTVRAYIRKLLAHQYEHLLELAARQGKDL